MSLGSAFGAFAQGFAASHKDKKDRAERSAVMAQNDKLIEIMGQQIKNGGMTGGLGAAPDLGYGSAAPTGGATTGSIGADTGGFKTGDLWSLMDKHEGGGDYDTLYGHSQKSGPFAGTKVSAMTVGQAIDFANPSGDYGRWVASRNDGTVATPMGRHQIVGSTLKRAAQAMGLDPSTPFNRQTQDAIAVHLASNRLKGASTPEAARQALRSEWVGFRRVPDAVLDSAIADFRRQHMSGSALGARPPVS